MGEAGARAREKVPEGLGVARARAPEGLARGKVPEVLAAAGGGARAPGGCLVVAGMRVRGKGP